MDCDEAVYHLAARSFFIHFAVALILLPILVTHFANGQAAPPAYPGSVEGHVTCNDGGFPARKATVSLSPIEFLLDPKVDYRKFPKFESNTQTDTNGNYFIHGVPAGEYFVEIHLTGYIDDLETVREVVKDVTPDRRKGLLASLPQVTVGVGRARQDIVIRRGGAVSGRVIYGDGGVLNRASISVERMSGREDTGKVPESVRVITHGVATDDRGVYRVPGLPKSKYRISIWEAYRSTHPMR